MPENQLQEDQLPELLHVTNLGQKKEFRKAIGKYVKTIGDWAEFGVRTGESANIFLKYGGIDPNHKLYLFDSWEGLPEDWTGHSGRAGPINKGAMKCDVPTFKDNRAVLVKGLFEDTLPQWIANYKSKHLAFIHIDSDIYSSAKTVLKYIHPLISEKTLIVFDEFCGYPAFREHEYKAFHEYIQQHNLKFKYIARSTRMAQVALRVYHSKN